MTRRTKVLLAAMATVALGAGCAVEDGNDPASASAAAVTGTTPNGLAQTVALAFRGSNWTGGCTGTLIGPKTILTAKHCIDGADLSQTGIYSPYPLGSGVTEHDTGHGALRVDVTKSYTNLTGDLAVLALTGALGPSLGLPAAGPYIKVAGPPCGSKASADGAMTNGVWYANRETSRVENLKVELFPCTIGDLILTESQGTGIPKNAAAVIESGDSGGLLYSTGVAMGKVVSPVTAFGVLSRAADPNPSATKGTASWTSLADHSKELDDAYLAIEGASPGFAR